MTKYDTRLALFENFPRNKFYFCDENNKIGIRYKGSVRWYDWDVKYDGYVWIGETNTFQGADKRRIPGR